MPPSMPGMKCSALGWVLPGDGRAEDLVHDQRSRSAEGRPGVGRDQSMNVVWTLLIVAGAVIGVAVARTFWRPLKWPTYAFATWLAVLLMAWPLSATGDVWKEIRVAWYIAFLIVTVAVAVILYGFVGHLLLRAGRAIIRRLRSS